jgi:hypothetical protein
MPPRRFPPPWSRDVLFRGWIYWAATAILPALLLMSGQQAAATDPEEVTLSCDGTVTDTSSPSIPADREPKRVEKMGVVANLNERTVSFMGFVVSIATADASTINFGGEDVGARGQDLIKKGYTTRIDGYLNRATGDMMADTRTYHTEKPSDVIDKHYDVTCKTPNRG